MQICPEFPSTIRALKIPLDPSFPIHAPYLDRLHYSRPHPAEHLHNHHSWEIGICLEGSGIFYIDNRVYHYTSGDVTVIPPHIVHIAQSDPENISGWKFLDIDLLLMLSSLSPEYSCFSNCSFKGVISPGEHPYIAPLVVSILEEMRSSNPHNESLIRLKVAELAIHLQRLSHKNPTVPMPTDSIYEISPALLHIINHYNETITLAQLAAMCSKSVSSFRRCFTQTMDTTPFEYLYHVRIKAAVNLLQTTQLPVLDISYQVGYQSLSSFNRHFLRITGMAPVACRKQKQS